jgi:hypothetical protein
MKLFSLVMVSAFATLACQAQSYTGDLATGDMTRDGGEFYDQYTFDVEGARKVTIRLESDDFDTYLVVRAPSGFETTNDDFDGIRVSQIDIWATEPGTWTVWATAYTSGSEGSYLFSMEEGEPATVEVIEGRLDPADAKALKGEYFDTHSWDAPGMNSFLVELMSLGFDGYLVVTSPSGQVWRNDDAGSVQLSRVGPVSGVGKWRFDVTSVSEGEVGAYDLRIIVLPKPQ